MSMEPSYLPAYVLSLVLLPLSLYLVSFLRNCNTKNLPPGTRGWPILGETVAFVFSGTRKFVEDRMKKYLQVDVIQTSLFGERVAIFCGPEANKFLFANENKLVSLCVPPSTAKVMFHPEFADIMSIPSISYTEIFKTEALKKKLLVIDAFTRQHMDRNWAPNNVVKAISLSKKYTFEISCRLFLGVVDHLEIEELLDLFEPLTTGMLSIPIDVPGTDYNRGMKGGKMVCEKIKQIIKERRKELMETKADERGDLLSRMIRLTNSSDQGICCRMVNLLVAGSDTASYVLTSIMYYLASLPHIYDAVLKEQMEIVKAKGSDELLTWEDIEKMKLSWNVARESLRLMPPGHGGFKETMTEFSYAGFTIPKGWKILWTWHSSYRNPKYFPEPERFDPSRFEGRGPAPYTFVPFGGGQRMCPGRDLARLEILVFIHNVVRRFRLEKVVPNEKILFKYSKPTPAHGLPIRLHPHDK